MSSETASSPKRDRQGPHRKGPRPLALHMLLSWGASTSWPGASMILNGSLPAATPELSLKAKALWERAAGADQAALARALAEAATQRQARFLEGLAAYRRHSYRRDLPDPPCLWHAGSARLLDYGDGLPAEAPLALVVPSLINRAYVLDLAEGASFLRWLAERGVRGLLLDWGAPGPEERGFTLDDVILGRLGAALAWSQEHFARRPVLVGYCMGGLLALGAGLAQPERASGLALLATPWDFHAEDEARIDQSAVQQHAARAAVAIVAAFLSASQPQYITQDFQQTLLRFAEKFGLFAVDGG